MVRRTSVVGFGACVASSVLVLSGCGVLPGAGDQQGRQASGEQAGQTSAKSATPSPESSALPTWSSFKDVGDTVMLVAAGPGRALVLPSDGSPGYVINPQGTKVWDIPEVTTNDFGFYYDDEHIYIKTSSDNAVIALDWATGAQAWKVTPTEDAPCADPSGYRLVPGAQSRATHKLTPDGTLALVWETPQYATEQYGPPECTDVSNAEKKPTPMNFGIDPKTGNTIWEADATPNLYTYKSYADDPLGKYLYMLWDLRGQMWITRIDTTTGEQANSAVDGLTPSYLPFNDSQSLITTGIDTFAVVSINAGAHAKAVSFKSGQDWGQLTLQQAEPDSLRSERVYTTPNGVRYSFAPPVNSGDDYRVHLVAVPGDRADATYSAWTLPAPDLLVPESEIPQYSYFSDSQIIDSEPTNPLILLPRKDGGIAAVQLKDGTEVWHSSGDTEPGTKPAFSQAGKIVNFLVGDEVVTVRADNGEEVSRETMPGVSQVWSEGQFQLFENRRDGPTQIRVIHE